MGRLGMARLLAIAFAVLAAAFAVAGCGSSSDESSADTGTSASSGATGGDGETIRVGILHSLSGTMAISEVTVRDSELLAIEEINRAGGVLGKQIEPVIEDGASDWPTFAEKAQKLISEDQVAATFGGWTSASRKAMLPVFERNRALLFYPVQYEGLEQSPYIFYSGATTNQQIIPGLEYLKETGARSLFLVGSDYVFPRTANKEIKAWAEANGVEILGEEYTPLGHTEYGTLISKLQDARPDAVFNTLNGDSNVAFFKQLKGAGVSARDMPVMSVSVAEEEVAGIGPENVAGHPVAWNYYQTTDTPANRRFVRAFKDRYGADRVTSDPMEAGYVQVHIWAKAVEKAGSTDPEAVKEAARGLTFDAPEGTVRVDDVNQHLYKTARIGVVEPDGQIREVWASDGPIAPDPYLRSYDWAEGL
jgi:urea transport system substrate-binding protein